MKTSPLNIRRYEPHDEAAAYEVCLRTGDNGNDATPLYDDPLVLGHIYVGPYLKLAPELAFVAEDAKGVCGYVLGALDSKNSTMSILYVTQWLPEIQRRYPSDGRSAGWTPTQRSTPSTTVLTSSARSRTSGTPSHLHIDLLPRAQGRGHGSRRWWIGCSRNWSEWVHPACIWGRGSPTRGPNGSTNGTAFTN